MGFHEQAKFPEKISFGSVGGVEFNTSVIEKNAGTTERVAQWPAPRVRYDVSYGVKSVGDATELIEFNRARLGPAYGFRFKDVLDFSTGLLSGSSSNFAFDDVVIGAVSDGSVQAEYSLIKEYTSGGIVRTRRILKPLELLSSGASACLVGWGPAGSEVVKVEGTDYTMDFATGKFIIPAGNSNTGDQVVWGGEYDIPMFFAEDNLPVEIADFGNREVPSINLVEDIEPYELSEEMWGGGGSTITPSILYLLGAQNGRAVYIDPQVDAVPVRLPDISNFPLGGPAFGLANLSGSNTVSIQDRTGNALFTLATSGTAEIWVFPIGTTKVWQVI